MLTRLWTCSAISAAPTNQVHRAHELSLPISLGAKQSRSHHLVLSCRIHPTSGVTIPSQRRYVRYACEYFKAMRRYIAEHKEEAKPHPGRPGLGLSIGGPAPTGNPSPSGVAPSPLAVMVGAVESFGTPRARNSTVALPLPGGDDALNGFKRFPDINKVMPSKV